mmetsp:Transcript_23476/g.32757  ORF Transcript_23476/g.32757 Transcript_23476/m.32757 type:complete len:152 (-) Transcript_23476:2395-2850(-)
MILSSDDIKSKLSDSIKSKYFKGVDLNNYKDGSIRFIFKVLTTRAKRKITRYIKTKNNKYLCQHGILDFLNKVFKRKNAQTFKTHVRNFIMIPLLLHKKISIYNGQAFSLVQTNVSMMGRYFGEFSLTYRPVKHGNPGIGATHSSRFIPLR